MISWFVRHPNAANLLMILFLILGAAAVPQLKRETFPDIPPDKVQISVAYRGASAQEVEEAVCIRLEDALARVGDMEETRCEAREGIGSAVAEMREGADFDRFQADVKTEVDAIDALPAETEDPVVRALDRVDFVASVAITGPMELADLKAYAEAFKRRLLRLPDVSRVEVKGFSDHQFLIRVPMAALNRYGLSADDLAGVVARQSVDFPAGSIESLERDLLIRFDDSRVSARGFRDLVVIGAQGGGEVRLGEIAEVADHFERAEEKVLFNGRRAAVLELSKPRDRDRLRAMDAIQAFLQQAREEAPPGIAFHVTNDRTTIVRDRLSMLTRNGVQGLALVFLVMWLFFSLRFSFWVSVGLPVSVLGTIFAMNALGFHLNMITMVGLLIALGLVMDDAIVIAENIAARSTAGESPNEASIQGTRQVMPGVMASFATTICVFGSLVFLEGRMGIILQALPVILILTLVVSLGEAFWILPNHLAHALSKRKPPTPLRLRLDAGIESLREAFGRVVVDRAVAWRYATAGGALFLLLASLSLVGSGTLKNRAFPDLEGDVMEARILLPAGTPLARTERVVDGVVAALERVEARFTPLQPGKQALVRNVAIYYNRNVDADESGPHVATVIVDLLGNQIRNARLDDVIADWREEVGSPPDVLSLKFTEPTHGPAGRAIDIRLMGEELDRLEAAAGELRAWFADYRGVSDLSTDLRPGKPEVRLKLRSGAAALGLDAASVADQVRAAFQGGAVPEIQVGPEAYEVEVRLADADRDGLEDLDGFYLLTAAGSRIPLSAAVEMTWERGFSRIHRVDGVRTVTIRGAVDARLANVKEIIADARKRFLPGLLERYPDVAIGFEGEVKEGGKTGGSIRRNFMIGLIGVFLLLAFQFRSYVEPFLVISVIPMGVVGALWGHVLLGLDFSMPSLLGLASLAGVAVNDSILIVEFIKRRVREGMNAEEAAKRAARERFRAILLTSLTTIAGLTPLLMETSLQAQVLIPLAVSLAFGLFTATVLALIIVPAFYVIMDDFGWSAVKVGPGPTEGNDHGG